MPTRRTKQIIMKRNEQLMISLAAYGMYVANSTHNHDGQNDTYGAFYNTLNHIMQVLCHHDPDFIELWGSHRIQGSLNIGDWANFPAQIANVLESEGIDVIMF